MATSYGTEQTYTFYGITFKVRVFATANITSQTDTSATVTFTSGIQYTSTEAIGATFHLLYQYLGTTAPSTEKLAERSNTAYFEELPKATSWTAITAFSNTVTKTVSKTQAAQTYTFYGEQIGSSSISDVSSFPSEQACGKSVSVTIPAKTSYAITYNANGGSGAPAAQTKWYGTAITLSSTQPTRSSYAFKRWNTNTADTGTAYSPGATYSANAALALYAIWNPIISYNANGGSGAPEAQTKTFGTALTLSSTVPTKSGYAFAVWNTASNGTGSSYDAGGSYTSNTAATLYAIWTPVVSYNANGGSGAPEAQTKPLSQALTLSSTVPTKAGFVFREWNTSSDGSGTSYQPGGTYSSTSTATMYAIWDAALTIGSFDVERADSSGNADAVGTYLKCTVAWSTTVEGVSAAFSCGSATSTVELSGSSGTTVGLLPASAVPTSDYTATVVVEDEVASKTASATTTAASTGYSLPAVQSITVARCDSHGTIEDDGLYALVTVAWKVSAVGSQTAPQSLTIKAYDGSAEVDSVTETSFSTASGTYMHVMGYGSTFSADRPYTFTATIADVVTTASKSDVMPIAYFPFDVLAGGHGIAFGKPAFQSELMDVGYDIHSDGSIDALGNLSLTTEDMDRDGEDPSANVNGMGVQLFDKDGELVGLLRTRRYTDGSQALQLYALNEKTDTTEVSNSFEVICKKDGSQTYSMASPANFRSAIGAAASSHTHTIGQVSWPAPDNLTCSASANNQEWSIDLNPGSYTGCYWHVWSGKNSKSILRCDNDTNKVSITNGMLEVRHNSTSYIAGLTNPAIYQPHPSSNAWSPIIAWRTKSQGGWSLGSYDTDNAQFSFGTSANISANNNSTTIVNLRPTAGTIALTSEVDGRVPKPAVLYNNGTGTNGTVSLSASAANYNHMRIHYRSNNSYYGSVVVYVPNGKKVMFMSGWTNSSTYGECALKTSLISGTSITNDSNGVFSNSGANGNNFIYIVRVEAWNE